MGGHALTQAAAADKPPRPDEVATCHICSPQNTDEKKSGIGGQCFSCSVAGEHITGGAHHFAPKLRL